jgi:CRISPR-associated protein Cmr3
MEVTMQTWIIEPRDPLIVRDGRPFSADIAGARATSLDFPFPSTTTGGVRTQQGLGKGGNFDAALIAELKQLEVCGPLLIELDDKGKLADWLLPAPADALWCNLDDGNGGVRKDRAEMIPLAPLTLPPEAFTNLPDDDLCPVGTWQPLGKPFDKPPRYWVGAKFKDWLTNAQGSADAILAEYGHDGPPKDTRTHVAIEPGSQTASDGALYQTRGLEFTHQAEAPKVGGKRLALAVWTAADKLKEALVPFGGERRLSYWHKSDKQIEAEFADCKEVVIEKIKQSKDGNHYFCRLVLLTPAHFTTGYCPDWLRTMQSGVAVELQGVAINRTQVVSGWDFDRTKSKDHPHGQPKATRRLAPAGSAYFLQLTGDENLIKAWCENVWLKCVSDDPQDNRDGFGLAVLGAWSGKCEAMEVKQ